MIKLPQLLMSETVKNRFSEILNQNANGFIQSLTNIYNNDNELKNCEPTSILSAAGLAATLHLAITPSLGQAYIIPFKNKAQFQIGWKGLVQLAHRTGKYKTINADVVYEGQIRDVNCVTGELITGEKISDEIVGYVAYMQLINGFEKSLYMTKAEIELHAQTYSQTYQADKQKKWSTWAKHFNQMACKTVLKLLLSRWGILSSDMAMAIQADQSTITKSNFQYVDNGGTIVTRESIAELDIETKIEEIDSDTGEIVIKNENNSRN